MIVLIVRRIYRDAILLIKKYAIVMGLYSILLLSMLFSMAEFSAKGGQAEWEPALTLFFTASIVIELLTFYFVIKAGESFEEKQKTDFMKLQNRMLRKSLNETEQTFQLWKKSIHDHKNTTIALLQLAEDEKLDELKKYLKQETYLIDRKMFYIKTGNSVVDAIINTKQNIAESKGISFIVNASLPEFCTIRDLDLAHILGNLLDNAMEASAGENEPCIDITIRQEKMFLIIKIVNSYSRKLPKNLRTAKKNSLFHGLGLESVKDIVKKYHGDFSIKQNNSQVIVQLLLLNRPA